MGVVNNEHRISKLEEDGGGGGLATRVEALETDVSHIEDEYTNLASYSTNEREIGEWIDGSTLYRKVYELDIDNTPDQHDHMYDIVADKNVINIKACLKKRGHYLNVPHISIDSAHLQNYNAEAYVVFYITNNQLHLITGADRSSFKFQLILEYTKNEE